MMAFRRKDIKKAYYYVWFLGAKESKGLRGEQYILPVLRQLVNIERRTEPCKLTLQVSNKGIKIIQNVPKQQTKTNSQTTPQHPVESQTINQSNTASSKQMTTQNSTVKMEQIKHFIPHHAVTCALQSEDLVCIILLLYNPLTGCPVHVHGYRCDSIETAFTLRNQLQLLIDRPENQRKFAEIESRLAAKGLISQQQLLNNSHHQQLPPTQKIIKSNQITNGKSDQYTSQQIINSKSINQQSTTQLIYNQHNNDLLLANRSKRNHTLTSDGRSAELDDCNQSDGYSPTSDGPTGLNKSLVESKSSSGNSSGSHGSSPPPQAPNPVVVEMYENLAAELKSKLGNPEIGPILLPPKDYDTVCRSQGRLSKEIVERACKNELVVGKVKKIVKKQVEKSDNLILDTNGKETKNVLKDNSKDILKDASKELAKDVSKDISKDKLPKETSKNVLKDASKSVIKSSKETSKVDSSSKDVPKANKEIIKKKNTDIKTDQNEQFDKIQKKLNQDEQEKRLDHQQIREHQKQYELKLKNLQRKQELYEQQQLLIEQQKQVKRELSQQHKLNSKTNSSNGKTKEQIKTNKSEDCQTTNSETSAVIQSTGIKLIGSSLANKIKQSLLIGSNNKKLEPQLICHKTIHDSLQSLNKLTKNDAISTDKLIMNKKQINNLIKVKNEKLITKKDHRNLLNTNTSNSSSNLSRDLNEKLNTINSRSDSSNVSKSISSGIGSGANLNTSNRHKNNPNINYEDAPYLSTDEDLEDEMLNIHDLSECVDEYMPTDYTYNQYLNDEEDEEDDEIIDDLDDDESNNNRVVRRMALCEKLLLLEKQTKSKNKKSEFDGSTGERVQTSSDDDGVNSICYDENLLPKINTAKRIKKPSSKSIKLDQKLVDNIKNAKNLTKNSNLSSSSNKIESTSITHSTKSTKSTNNIQSTNQVKRSETYYEMGQKRMFHNNYYFPHNTNKSPIDGLLQPKLFYFPNPDFKAAQQQLKQQHLINPSSNKQPQLIKYHLGQPMKQCELRRQKSTPNVNAKFNYHPMLINGKSVEKLISNEEQMINRKIVNMDKFIPSANLVHQRTRPISMVNMMQPEHFRISHHHHHLEQSDKLIDQNAMFKRVPIYY